MRNRQWVGGVFCSYFIVITSFLTLHVQAGSLDEISYQGHLLDGSGNSITGSYNFEFSIWGSESGPDHIWPSLVQYEEHYGVVVTDGLFNVMLGSQGMPLNSNFFDGSDRYLEIRICDSPGISCSTFQTLQPRQKLTSAGYAQQAKSFIPGLTMSNNGNLLTLTTTSDSGTAISAMANSSTGSAAAIYGQASASYGAGVAGYNLDTGYGIYGSSDIGYGVYGYSPSGYAIYANGKAHVNGELTWTDTGSYISLAPAAFSSYGGICIEQQGASISGCPGTESVPCAIASVQLPHGAILTTMTVHWSDSSTAFDGEAMLCIVSGTNSYMAIASCQSTGSSGAFTTSSSSDFGEFYRVDNDTNAYFILLTLPAEDENNRVNFHKFEILYAVSHPY